jgi:hypothetical protein
MRKDGAQAETHRGVHNPLSAKAREHLNAEAVQTASAPDQNAGSGSRVNSKVISTMPHPLEVRAESR